VAATFARPPHASTLFGWSILPLRAFLGFTFCFAGLQKLANPNFLNANSPSGIHAQLIAAIRTSPLHALLGHFLAFATPIGVLIALGELAVGLGTLLGLWTRLAAMGGLTLSLILFLTVSFHSSPYYTGADIVFAFAWLSMIVGGAGGVLSVDAFLQHRALEENGESSAALVVVPFDVVQQVCGQFDSGCCAARGGRACEVAPCPFLKQGRQPLLARRPDAVDRRTVVLRGTAAGVVGALGLIGAGVAAALGRMVGGAKAPEGGEVSLSTHGPKPPQGSVPPSASHPPGTAIGPTSEVPVGGAAAFTDPATGSPGLVLQLSRGAFSAYNAVCPHAGCTVEYSGGSRLIVCPCHGSIFNPANGDVEGGPAPRGLTKLQVAVGSDSQLYVNG
jgi:thiosulfate dehydrogenase [quinone] large subunit